VQVCGLVHDAGHRTIFGSPALDNALGNAFTVFLAMGFDSWRVQHNIHHAHTNVDGVDPDLDIPLHAFTARQFANQRGPLRPLRRYQAFIFLPMRCFVVISRRLADVAYYRGRPFSPGLAVKITLWLAGLALWFAVPFLVFPLGKALLLLLIVHPLMGLYLSNVFAPNHKGMPQLLPGTRISFLEQQIMTSRNVTPGWLTDIVYMGLNYQIEHHLFPACPRNRLKDITPYVRAVCRETGIEYTQAGVLKSNRLILAELNRIARSATA
jgi:fatty acid desaturase